MCFCRSIGGWGWGGGRDTAQGPVAVLAFNLPLSTGKRCPFFYSYPQNQYWQRHWELIVHIKKMQDPVYLPVSTQKLLPRPPSCTVQLSSRHSLLQGHQQSPKSLQETSPVLCTKLSLSYPSPYSEIPCSNYTLDLFSVPKKTWYSPPSCLCICGPLCLRLLHSLLSAFSTHQN